MHCQLACAEIRAGVRTVASFHWCACIGVVHGNTNHASTGNHTGNHTSHPGSRRPSESTTRFLSTPSLDGEVFGGRQVLESGGAGEGDHAASRTREPGMVKGAEVTCRARFASFGHASIIINVAAGQHAARTRGMQRARAARRLSRTSSPSLGLGAKVGRTPSLA